MSCVKQMLSYAAKVKLAVVVNLKDIREPSAQLIKNVLCMHVYI